MNCKDLKRIEVDRPDDEEGEKYNPEVQEIPKLRSPIQIPVGHLPNYKFILQPDYQRAFIWKKDKQKELIKSLFSGIPLPLFYFAKRKDGSYEVIDGQQRLTTILGFLSPTSKAICKDVRKKLVANMRLIERKVGKDIAEIRREILNRYIYVIEIPEVELPLSLKYSIFIALNKGAVRLNSQEIRNCIFQQDMPYLNAALKKGAKMLLELLKEKSERMEAEELVLRFFIINKFGYGKKDVSDLLEDIKSIKSTFTPDEVEKTLNEFKKKFIQRIEKIFPDKNSFSAYFQVLRKDAQKPKKSADMTKYVYSGKLNQGLYHLFSYYLTQYDNAQFKRIARDRKRIQRGYIKLLQNEAFVNVITGSSTNNPKKIKQSKKLFEELFVKEYLGEPSEKKKRNLHKAEKKAIFASVPYCYLCYGRLNNTEEAEGEYIVPHAEHIKSHVDGGDSKFKNILLSHPKCNLKKSADSLEDFRDTPYAIQQRKKNKKNIEDYLTCLKSWHTHHPLDDYKKLRAYALKDNKKL